MPIVEYVKRWIVGPRIYLHCQRCGRRLPRHRIDSSMCSDDCTIAQQSAILDTVFGPRTQKSPPHPDQG